MYLNVREQTDFMFWLYPSFCRARFTQDTEMKNYVTIVSITKLIAEIEVIFTGTCKIRPIFLKIKCSKQLLIKFQSVCDAIGNPQQRIHVLDMLTRWKSNDYVLQLTLKRKLVYCIRILLKYKYMHFIINYGHY